MKFLLPGLFAGWTGHKKEHSSSGHPEGSGVEDIELLDEKSRNLGPEEE